MTRFFLTLLIASIAVFASNISIIAKVNQTPITSFDVEERIILLSIIMPDFKKYSNSEQKQIALQNLVQDALRHEYVKKTNFQITDSEKIYYRKSVIKRFGERKIPNMSEFERKYSDFIATETLWHGVMEKNFMSYIKISDEMVESVQKSNPNMTREQIHNILTIKQLESYSAHAIESIRKISIIDIL